jgi:hypothetical protein
MQILPGKIRSSRSFIGRALLGLALLGSGAAAVAAERPTALRVVAVAPQYPGRMADDDRWLIYLDGPIDPGATARVVNLVLAERISRATVFLNSPGGSLVTAMQLGRVLREHAFDARVGTRTTNAAQATAGTCHSACPFVLAGGIRRSLEMGSAIGLHRAENRVPVGDGDAFQQVVRTQVVEYLAEMGVRAEVADIMAAIPHDRIRDLTVDEALRLNLLNQDR